MILNIVFGICAGLGLAALAALIVLLVKINNAKKRSKLAKKINDDKKFELIIHAINKLAENNGQQNSYFIKQLNEFEFNADEFKKLKLNKLAEKQKISDKKVDKVSSVKL